MRELERDSATTARRTLSYAELRHSLKSRNSCSQSSTSRMITLARSSSLHRDTQTITIRRAQSLAAAAPRRVLAIRCGDKRDGIGERQRRRVKLLDARFVAALDRVALRHPQVPLHELGGVEVLVLAQDHNGCKGAGDTAQG